MNLPGPDEIFRHRLPNGLTVLALRRPDLPFACLSLEVPAGSKLDSPATAGLAALTAAALTRGTRRRTADQLFAETEGLGMELSSSSGADVAAVDMRTLLEDLPRALAIMAEVALEPAFTPAEVEKIRGQTMARLEEAEDDADYVAERELRRQVFPPGHPYRLPTSGYKDTVARLESGDLAAFHQRQYTPQGAALAVVGDIDVDRLVPHIEAAFGQWRPPAADGAGKTAPEEEETARPQEPIRITLAGKSQSEIAVGGQGPARTDPQYESLSLANLILGRLGLGGRIGANVRERLGLAYSAYSTLVGFETAGMWMVRAGVGPGAVDQALAAIMAELEAFSRNPVTEQELADAKGFLLGSLPLRLERAAGMVNLLLAMERYQLGLDYLQRYPDLVQGLTADDLLAAVQRHIRPEASITVVAGPDARQGAAAGTMAGPSR